MHIGDLVKNSRVLKVAIATGSPRIVLEQGTLGIVREVNDDGTVVIDFAWEGHGFCVRKTVSQKWVKPF